MKKENTATRLKELMEERNLRQVDILKLVEPYCKQFGLKMNKSDISQYCSGKVEPHQDKLYALSLALNVSPAWLMGFAVPKERESSDQATDNIEYMRSVSEKASEIDSYKDGLSLTEISLIERYRSLDDYGKRTVNAVLDMEFERCEDDEEQTVVINEEMLRSMPTSTRLMFLKYQQDDQIKLVARGNKK